MSIHFLQVTYPFLICAGICLLGAVGCGIGVYYESHKQKNLQQYGLLTQAQVVSQRKALLGSRGNKRTSYFLTCRFYYEGQPFEYERQIARYNVALLPAGALIPVRFLPGKPSTMQIEGEASAKSAAILGLVACIVASLVFLSIVFLGYMTYH